VGGQTQKMQEREGLKNKADEGVKKIGGGAKRKTLDGETVSGSRVSRRLKFE
jgi:hypothetical protein